MSAKAPWRGCYYLKMATTAHGRKFDAKLPCGQDSFELGREGNGDVKREGLFLNISISVPSAPFTTLRCVHSHERNYTTRALTHHSFNANSHFSVSKYCWTVCSE